METTVFIARIIGPVLLLRVVSIIIDRRHFVAMLEGLDREVETVSFSLFPVAMLMGFIALANVHTDTSTLAALVIHGIAWLGALKVSAVILFPRAVVAKAQVLVRAGFLNVVLAVCLVIGAYFTWFGYLAPTRGGP
jgi:hypothetical protein